jgi:hypothetical protein
MFRFSKEGLQMFPFSKEGLQMFPFSKEGFPWKNQAQPLSKSLQYQESGDFRIYRIFPWNSFWTYFKI